MPVNFLVIEMYNTVYQKVTKKIFSTQFCLIICWSVYFSHTEKAIILLLTVTINISMKFIIISSVYALAAVIIFINFSYSSYMIGLIIMSVQGIEPTLLPWTYSWMHEFAIVNYHQSDRYLLKLAGSIN